MEKMTVGFTGRTYKMEATAVYIAKCMKTVPLKIYQQQKFVSIFIENPNLNYFTKSQKAPKFRSQISENKCCSFSFSSMISTMNEENLWKFERKIQKKNCTNLLKI
jgi:hypothetical protein